ncbi:hypothetical protein [Chitinivorax sp. B]|uniref:DUF6970 domain-containing protein n=1 Tax=Chitinivorax sp. B TaxID=2502235 RepID=UPI0010F5404E|nr:hypothetical protein [Chitinivorax sp. B]
MKTITTILLSLVSVTGLAQTPTTIPMWISQRIQQFESAPITNPPRSIWQYRYQGKIVYYFPPQCCDQFSELYDQQGTRICAPDGGITGVGDGECPDFRNSRSQEKRIWKDTRSESPPK